MFFVWLPLFLSPPGSSRLSLRHEYFKSMVVMRKFFRGARARRLSVGLEKTG